MKDKFKVPKLKAEKKVAVGTTTSGAPAQAETTVVERKKRVLSPEQKARAVANLVKAREAKRGMHKGTGDVAVQEFRARPAPAKKARFSKKMHIEPETNPGDEMVRAFKSMKRAFNREREPAEREYVAGEHKQSMADVKEMRDVAKGYTELAKKHRHQAKEAMEMAKELREKAKHLTSTSKAGKKAFHSLPGAFAGFKEGIEYA